MEFEFIVIVFDITDVPMNEILSVLKEHKIKSFKINEQLLGIQYTNESKKQLSKFDVKRSILNTMGMINVIKNHSDYFIKKITNIRAEMRLCETVCEDGVTRYMEFFVESDTLDDKINGKLFGKNNGFFLSKIDVILNDGNEAVIHFDGCIYTNDIQSAKNVLIKIYG